jgi:nucleotide-binding universal stress UspA family protein
MTLNQERIVEHGTLALHAVVVAVDGSRTSLRAADYALGLAYRTGSAVVGVYVCRFSSLAVGTPAVWIYTENAQEQVADEMTEYLAERAKELGISHGFVVLSGHPARQIRQLADELLASAVVVGASERLAHRVCGSLAARLARAAHQPVIVVP